MFLDVHTRSARAWLDWVARRGLPLVLGDPLRTLTAEQRRRRRHAAEIHRAARLQPPTPVGVA